MIRNLKRKTVVSLGLPGCRRNMFLDSLVLGRRDHKSTGNLPVLFFGDSRMKYLLIFCEFGLEISVFRYEFMYAY